MSEPVEEIEQAPLKVAIQTYGCRSNYADTIDLQAALLEQGASPCGMESEADVYVVNTCTVTDNADKDALKLIRRLKEKNPEAKIVITGCMAAVSQKMLEELVGEGRVVGPGQKASVLAAVLGKNVSVSGSETQPKLPVLPDVHPSGRRVRKSLPQRRSISISEPISEYISGPGRSMGEVRNRARYHLRVQEGCENACTFCIIPQTRGRLSSRPIAEVLNDIRHLAARGYREVVLTGTHLGGYGEDVGLNLKTLLQEVAALDAGPRIRLSSLDPNDLSPEIIDVIAESDVFCSHLHICVQAFTDRTLKRMNRRYRMDEARELLWYTERRLPQSCIGSDIITGFPGESRQEVEEGIEEFLRLPISYLHVFPYSERTGTAATNLDGAVAIKERKRRAARWRAVAHRKRVEYLSGLVGKELEVIIERKVDDYYLGTSGEFASVKIEQPDAAEEWTKRYGDLITVQAVRCDRTDGTLVCRLSSRAS